MSLDSEEMAFNSPRRDAPVKLRTLGSKGVAGRSIIGGSSSWAGDWRLRMRLRWWRPAFDVSCSNERDLATAWESIQRGLCTNSGLLPNQGPQHIRNLQVVAVKESGSDWFK
ncbi:unnamed protein product [Linum trigynum]|uniref:Uncharacterized protein n=1 Tax=Linum trigynum TaxID=586398 RepID=A0AAV2GMY2_9ROSI